MDQFGDVSGATLSSATWPLSCIAGASKEATALRAANATAAVTSDAAWEQRGLGAWVVYPQNTFIDASGAAFDVESGAADPQRQPITTCTAGPTTPSPPASPAPTPPSATAALGPVPLLGSGDAVSSSTGAGASNSGSCAAPSATAGVEGDRRSDVANLRLAVYNAEFLFDGVDDSQVSRWRGDPVGAQAHLEAVAAFVATWVADVVALVEVEGCGSLAELAAVLRTLPRGGGGAGAAPDPESAADVATGYLLQGTDSFTEQDVALLTTVDPSTELTRVEDRLAYPLEDSGCGFDDERDTGVSKHFVARWDGVRLGGTLLRLAIVAVHFKAFPTDPRSCAQREAQAALVRREVAALAAAGYEVVVMGDVNDFSVDPPDAAGSMPTSRVLDILAGTAAGFEGGPVLRNVMELVPQAERITSWFDRDRDGVDDGLAGRENSAIDHVLLSPGLWGRVSDVRFIRDAPPGVDGGALSDHWPIVVTLSATAADGVCDDACRQADRGFAAAARGRLRGFIEEDSF